MSSIPVTPVPPERTARDPLPGSVARLFSPSEASGRMEREAEEWVASVTEDFLRAPAITSEAELESLRDAFGSSDIPVHPADLGEYLDGLARNLVHHSVRVSSPRFIGHMTSALPFFVRPLAKLMTAMNQNVVKVETSRAGSLHERQALGMLHRLVFGFPEEFYRERMQNDASTLGILASGGTVANITALWCARNAALGPGEGFAGVEEEGLPAALHFHGCRRAVVIGSELLHYSVAKAMGLLGLGEGSVVRVPVGADHRVRPAALERAARECRSRGDLVLAVIGIAGTTESGAVDPLRDLAGIARDAGARFHVDAAWGGPLLFSERHRAQLDGIELADSVTIDGHKQLYLPLGIGMVLFRDAALAGVIEKHAQYIIRRGSMDQGRRSLEGSRPGMALFLHAALNLIGRRGYEHLVDEGIRKARYMSAALRGRPDFELLLEPQTNILLYRYLPEPFRAAAAAGALTDEDERSIDAFNARLQRVQRQAGSTFVSRTAVRRREAAAPTVALRAVIANPLTSEADIDAVLADQARIGARLAEVRLEPLAET
jgi:glutamate decarboxylase